MALKFAMILEAVDRFTRPGRRAQAAQRDLTKGARDLARAGTPAARAMDRMSSAAARMRGRLATSLASVRALAGRAGMKALEKSAYGAGYAIGWTVRKVASLAAGLAKLAAGAAIVGGGAFFGGVISTTAKFEQFQMVLEGIEGSAEKAKASMKWVQSFAEKTPYELDQVMEAFVRLKTYGIDPMDGTLRSAGDAASAMGKDLMSAVEAIADAQTGEMERLKELGITVRREGGKVRMIYSKNGKDMEKVVADNRKALRDGVTGIWDELFGGGMERQSTTFAGMINNLKDRWTGFLLRVGQAGIFDKVKGKLEDVLNWLDKKLADGSMEKWAQRISTELEKVVGWVENLDEADLQNFAGDLKSIASAIGGLVRDLGTLYGWVKKIDGAWAGVDANIDRWRIGGSGWGEYFRGQSPLFSPASRAAPAPKGKALPQPARDRMWQRALTPAPGAAPFNLRGGAVKPGASAPQKVAVGGAMEVRIKADPGLIARPGNMASANPAVPLVYRGAAMGARG